jgi:squalene-hopene/tetraprenyl-beta-curcumene cyclase
VEEAKPLLERVLARQNPDGGWSQSKGMKSDAFATGQALYALGEHGRGQADPAVRKGHAFLVKSQRRDGSWEMTSRSSEPGGKGAANLVPITGAGTAWATLGLVRTSLAAHGIEKSGRQP